MLVEVMEAKRDKKEAIKYIYSKTPLMSRVTQFNKFANNVHIEYVEFKLLSYEIVNKVKLNKLLKHEKNKKNIIMLVNTYNGYSQSIELIPPTYQKYISKSCIKQSKIKEDDIINEVKNHIMCYLEGNNNLKNIDKLSLDGINIKEVKSIYKPYWVAEFNGKYVFVDA